MKSEICFLILAAALAAIAGYLLLDDSTSFPDGPAFDANTGDRRAKSAVAAFSHSSPPPVPSPAEANRAPISKRPIELSDALARKRFEKRELERQYPLGMAGLVSDAIDPQEIEKRILGKQRDESLRHPAYLSSTFGKQFKLADPDDSEEFEEHEDSTGGAAVHFSENETALNDDEDELEEAGIDLSDTGRRALTHVERSGEPILLTEAGVPLGGKSIIWEEIEDRRLNE